MDSFYLRAGAGDASPLQRCPVIERKVHKSGTPGGAAIGYSQNGANLQPPQALAYKARCRWPDDLFYMQPIGARRAKEKSFVNLAAVKWVKRPNQIQTTEQ